jgi:hypothetical protein
MSYRGNRYDGRRQRVPVVLFRVLADEIISTGLSLRHRINLLVLVLDIRQIA